LVALVITENILSQFQAAEMGFLRRVHSVTLRDKVRSCKNRRALNVESLLLRIKRSQPHWFGHVYRMPHERLARQVLLAKPTAKRSRGRLRIRWIDYISDLTWSGLGVEPAELPEIAVDREVFRVLLGLLPRDPP